MQKIIFFDIDRTLYDYEEFLDKFSSTILQKYNLKMDQKEELKIVYEENKIKYGYFAPDKFIKPIIDRFPFMDENYLNSVFWSKDLLENNLYPDSKVLYEIAKIATIGIFSKGDEKFQKAKVEALKNIIDQKNIYIYIEKTDFIEKLLEAYKGYKIYLVDDSTTVLLRAEELGKEIFTILIDRKYEVEKSGTIDAKIDNLYQMLPLIK